MPERYTLTASREVLTARYKIDVHQAYTPTFNAAPTKLHPVTTAVSPQGFSFFYYGTIPGWGGNKSISSKLLHVHKTDVESRSAVRKLLRTQRCLIPLDGFYLWKKVSKKSKIPYRFTLQNKGIFSVPGFWEEFEDENDELHHTFRIIITDTPSIFTGFENNFPVILDPEVEKKWIDMAVDESELVSMLTNSMGDKMNCYTVSKKIEELEADHEGLIAPAPSMDQFGNYSLFD